MTDVKEKWALVTGASRGVGRQIALFMAKEGCNLILHSRNKTHTAALEQELCAYGVQAYSVEAELSEPDAVRSMLDEIEAHGTQVDIVFNDAGLQTPYRADFWSMPVEDYLTSFQVNMIAPALICYRLMPKMIERGFGRIINTTSGIADQPQQEAYSSSKGALDKFSRDLASVVQGTDVMINTTDPGWCRTDLGGPQAPNSVESCVPGIVVGAFLDDKKSGRLLPAQAFAGMTLHEAVEKAAAM